ncbi:hypothetical protein BDZ89DRAFT_245218 [Hymenopellis radicata]|nr:hypothetical protein BDZ89DRAFT_245218 [Hymenopellis radicata]
MSSNLSREQTSSSTERSSLSGQTLNDYLPLPDGSGTEGESEDFPPSGSTLEASSEDYFGAVCHGTVSIVPCRRGNRIETTTHIQSIIDRTNIMHGGEWESDMNQAGIEFTSRSTLKITIKSGAFPTFDSFATFVRPLIHNPCRVITLDLSDRHCPGICPTDTRPTSVAEWRNVVLGVMDSADSELDDDDSCEVRCTSTGGDVTHTLNIHLRPDRARSSNQRHQ